MTENVIEQHHRIRDILLKEWDPIGIRDIPEAQDEYDGYVPHISSMIALKKSVDEISDYLLWAETDNMGLVADQRKARLIAAKLATLSE